ncbi:lytic transglycosylase domain-containing protein [bacterium]|nr:lytic transglycosylase domain-containing protein [bacterium]
MSLRGAAIIAACAALACAPARLAAQEPPAAPGRFDLRAMFAAVGRMYAIDPDLLAAIAAAESDGRPDAISPKGAEGLMQLMPATARRYRVDDPFDPVESALGAARMLDDLRRRNDDAARALPDLLAAYNAGLGAVDRYHGIPPYPETKRYVHVVIERFLLNAPAAGAGRAAAAPRAPGFRESRGAARISAPASPPVGDDDLLAQLGRIRRARALARRERSAD